MGSPIFDTFFIINNFNLIYNSQINSNILVNKAHFKMSLGRNVFRNINSLMNIAGE